MHLPSPTTSASADPAACLAALICENAILARHLAAAQARCAPTAPAAAPDATATVTPPPARAATPGRPRRRKLHELPPQAQDLLLALSFAPASLRAEIEKALTRMRGQPVQLLGSEADLLYSTLHDLRQRNALSDALHRRLEARHAVAVRRLAPLREAEALRQAWLTCLQASTRPHEEMPAMLWALLTHPLGETQEVRALAEARTWVFAQARQGRAATDLAKAQRLRESQAELTQLRQRLQHEQARHTQEVQQLRLLAARQLGEARRSQALDRPAADTWQPMQAPKPRAGRPASDAATAAATPTWAAAASADRPRPAPAPPAAHAGSGMPPLVLAPAPSPVQGRRVLCVGGIQHAVSRYRSRVETLGGRFEHHDGGLHDNPHALDGRLARADLVICQAGCINHAAYHRIKQHCQRTGTPCLYLERASLSRFDRALQDLQAASGREQ